jgi:carbon monoxide dehydrogenase subunit G
VRFDNAFDVQAPIGEVWTAVLDVERVAPCVPGAEVLEQVSEDTYKVGIKIRIGPIVQQYRGEIEILERDESARRAVMRARAREMRGQGRAEGRVELHLTEDGATTHGDMATEVTLSGPAAAMGRGLIQDVSARIVDDFATNLAAMLAGGPAEAPEPAPIPETAAPDAPTREFPTLAAARPQGPDTAPPPESEVTAAPPAGAAAEAALGPSDEEPTPPPPPDPAPPHPAEVPSPAAAAATGGPSASAGEPAADAPSVGAGPSAGPGPSVGSGPSAGPGPSVGAGPSAGPGPSVGAGPSAGPGPSVDAGPSAGAGGWPTGAPPGGPTAGGEREAALPVLAIVGDVALRKLREPKVIGAIAAVAVVGLMLRRRRRH